ncbi:eotaxin-like [Perognathus longimembris pacificus]|uniref:eotaxin-like n=1 Tax=Perognathus longimembris pacificus TaxID=214514 RepID=UPI002019EC4D|nr:eotaxin-like [Perognathus longimembris pacificus]
MKVSAALLCLLLTAISPQGLAEPASVPTICCFTLTINRSVAREPQKNHHSRCRQKAIIFKTKLGKEIGPGSNWKWVQDSIKNLDQKKKKK